MSMSYSTGNTWIMLVSMLSSVNMGRLPKSCCTFLLQMHGKGSLMQKPVCLNKTCITVTVQDFRCSLIHMVCMVSKVYNSFVFCCFFFYCYHYFELPERSVSVSTHVYMFEQLIVQYFFQFTCAKWCSSYAELKDKPAWMDSLY